VPHDLNFEVADGKNFTEQFDAVFSNAVPIGLKNLKSCWLASGIALKPGGRL